MIYFGLPLILISNTARFELISSDFYTDISCLGGVFVKNTRGETKNFPRQGKFSLKTGIFRKYPSQT